MIRTFDPVPFLTIAADDDAVRRHLGFRPEATNAEVNLAICSAVSSLANVALLTPDRDGGYLLVQLQPGLYAAHTLAAPSARGAPMLQLMREGFRFMFTATQAIEITTMVLEGNSAARAWAGLAGFRKTFERDHAELGRAQHYALTYGEWVMRDDVAGGVGESFRDRAGLEASAADQVHDKWVGATLLGALAGNSEKAVGLYNRWAPTAGYAPVSLVSQHPPLVHMGAGLVSCAQGAFEVHPFSREARPS